jgi:hypothetical protein
VSRKPPRFQKIFDRIDEVNGIEKKRGEASSPSAPIILRFFFVPVNPVNPVRFF